eukprot:TRINITY_DN22340_c0_g1_i1.p1 TRINITY_DN22340_c0_g1~~TRINITY_DN22340_c0_g1_i1.p1  ORF type:complete len:164 (-),score=53.91 TRINITY_DN22340_c0_g1_i1:30-521(-)
MGVVFVFFFFCLFCFFFFFFFKQKTAYEMQRGLVGSEMCIRDSYNCFCCGAKGSWFDLTRALYSPKRSDELRLNSVEIQPVSDFTHILPKRKDDVNFVLALARYNSMSVSYTHLTLPTILLVQISVVAASLKKKKILEPTINQKRSLIKTHHLKNTSHETTDK